MIDWQAAERLSARPRPGDSGPGSRHPALRGQVPGELGIWIFVLGDLVVFGWFFVVLVHERNSDVAGFDAARQTLDLGVATVNTLALLVGSLLVVHGLNAMRAQASARAARYFTWTLACAAVFIAGKAVEYTHQATSGHTPAEHDFYMYFYMLTGIHLLHLLVATVLVELMRRTARRPRVGAREIRNLEAYGIFWHLVDLLWLVLFTLFYLMR